MKPSQLIEIYNLPSQTSLLFCVKQIFFMLAKNPRIIQTRSPNSCFFKVTKGVSPPWGKKDSSKKSLKVCEIQSHDESIFHKNHLLILHLMGICLISVLVHLLF